MVNEDILTQKYSLEDLEKKKRFWGKLFVVPTSSLLISFSSMFYGAYTCDKLANEMWNLPVYQEYMQYGYRERIEDLESKKSNLQSIQECVKVGSDIGGKDLEDACNQAILSASKDISSLEMSIESLKLESSASYEKVKNDKEIIRMEDGISSTYPYVLNGVRVFIPSLLLLPFIGLPFEHYRELYKNLKNKSKP